MRHPSTTNISKKYKTEIDLCMKQKPVEHQDKGLNCHMYYQQMLYLLSGSHKLQFYFSFLGIEWKTKKQSNIVAIEILSIVYGININLSKSLNLSIPNSRGLLISILPNTIFVELLFIHIIIISGSSMLYYRVTLRTYLNVTLGPRAPSTYER